MCSCLISLSLKDWYVPQERNKDKFWCCSLYFLVSFWVLSVSPTPGVFGWHALVGGELLTPQSLRSGAQWQQADSLPRARVSLVLGPFPQLWCCSGNPLVCVQFLLRIPFWCTFICSACRSAESNHRPRISLKPVVNPHSEYCPLLLPTRSRYLPSLMLVIAFSFRVFFHEETWGRHFELLIWGTCVQKWIFRWSINIV